MTKDKKDWIPLLERRPPRFLLVEVRHYDERIQSGWWTGVTWDGRRRINADTILEWRSLEASARKELNEC